MEREIASQYQAALKMLTGVIDKCPDGLWANVGYPSPYWQVVYHSLHYTNFYLSANENAFIGWHLHRPGVHQLGSSSELLRIAYSKDELLGYAADISDLVDARIKECDMTAPSGFDWLPMNRLELHFYNIRHLQHHTGQLVERLHATGIKGIAWVGIGR